MNSEHIAKLRAKLAAAEAREGRASVDVLVSFRIETLWSDRLNEECGSLGVTRSEYLREMLRKHLGLAAVK